VDEHVCLAKQTKKLSRPSGAAQVETGAAFA
jgi:hypothetical protein